jgi:polyisoprenoid-binding protein YceI
MKKTNWTRTLMLLTLVALTAGLALSSVADHHESKAPGTLEFKANNNMYSAHGKFERWHFTKVDIPDGDLTQGTVEFEVALASVWEKAEKLADHLRTADFFDVDKFGTATVKVHSAEKIGDNTYSAVATVSLHGHTNDVPAEFTVTGTDPLTIEGTATLDRVAFGIGGEYDPSNDRSIVQGVAIMLNATVSE